MPVAIALPPTEELHQLFEYRDGSLFWRVAKGGLAKVGGKAGCVNSAGYLTVGINFKKYLVHRIVWAMHGKDPVGLIDHINSDKLDNRIENLRAADHVINTRNAKLRRDSTSGIKGVSWRKQDKKWAGQVWHEGRLYRAGYFKDKDECAAAVRSLREKLHGEFACHG
jgi:hypothetical protein